jgi:chemotaxis protein MotA
MDIATIIGIIAGFGLILLSILLGGDLGIFINVPSIIIVFGGTLASTLINFPLSDVLSIVGPVRNAFFNTDKNPAGLINKIIEFATIARREGILALEGQVGEAGDEFLGNSIQLAIDGTAPELIKDILTTEVAFMEDRHAKGQSVLSSMGAAAPAFGMIGTLIGLVTMLAGMDDPSAIGAGMATALLTTLYGSVLSNVVFLPLAGVLKVRTAGEMLTKEIIIEGILAIQSGDNPRAIEQKLKAFLSPAQREAMDNES